MTHAQIGREPRVLPLTARGGKISAQEHEMLQRLLQEEHAAHLLLLGQGRVQTCPNVDPLAGHGDILTV